MAPTEFISGEVLLVHKLRWYLRSHFKLYRLAWSVTPALTQKGAPQHIAILFKKKTIIHDKCIDPLSSRWIMERLSVSWINNRLSTDYPLTIGAPSIFKEPSLKRWSSAISGAAGRQLPGWCTTGKRLVNYYTNPCWSLLIYSIILTFRKYRCIYTLYDYILHIDDYILYTILYYSIYYHYYY